MKVLVKVPATTANLGPGFDALGLALTLWNETAFEPAEGFSLWIEGEGAESLAANPENLIVRAARRVYKTAGRQMPPLGIRCTNRIPLGAGLGSSAAAILTGLLGANALLSEPLSRDEILALAVEIEGHPDNVAPSLLGGLVVSTADEDRVIAHRIEGETPSPPLYITITIPDFVFPTREARAALPKQVPLEDAVYNIGRAVLVAEALRTGDLGLLGQVMDDALHQPHRLLLIPGAQEAMEAAKRAGAAAAALSGAGPGLVAFSAKREPGIGAAMQRAFAAAGLRARSFELGISQKGAEVGTL